MSKPTHLIAEATYTIPEAFETEIGRIIVRWAYFEDLVQMILWDLLDLEPAFGRIAIREPRLTDRLDMIREISELRGLATFPNWAAFVKDAAKLEGHRNLIAHSAWTQDSGGNWFLERTTGSYKPAAFLPAVSRRAEPTAVAVDLPMLRDIAAGIETLIRPAIRLHNAAHATRRTSS